MLITEQPSRFHAYWWTLRDGCGDRVPDWTEMDPAAIKPALPFVLLHDLGTPDSSIIRLAGTAMVDRYGFDPTGRNYLDFVSEDRRETAYRELIRTSTHPCGMRVVVEVRYVSGKRTVAESLGYPFTGRNGQPLMMFVDEMTEEPVHDLDQRSKPMEVFLVRERDYVDVGFGTPDPTS